MPWQKTAVLALLVMSGCSGSSTTSTFPATTLPPPPAVSVENVSACGVLPGSVFKSVELHPGGEASGGGVAEESWSVDFSQTAAEWLTHDTGMMMEYVCNGGVISASGGHENWLEVDGEVFYQDDRLLLYWDGVMYERVGVIDE